MTLPGPDHPSCIRHNQRVCRIAKTKPGHKAKHVKIWLRMRDIALWRCLNCGLSRFAKRSGPGPISPLRHAVPFHMFPLSDRIEATRRRAKGADL